MEAWTGGAVRSLDEAEAQPLVILRPPARQIPIGGTINDVVASSPRQDVLEGRERARPDRRQVRRVARSNGHGSATSQARADGDGRTEDSPCRMAAGVPTLRPDEGYCRNSGELAPPARGWDRDRPCRSGRPPRRRPRQSPRESRARRNRPGPRRPNSTLTPVSSDGRRPFRPVRPGSEGARRHPLGLCTSDKFRASLTGPSRRGSRKARSQRSLLRISMSSTTSSDSP